MCANVLSETIQNFETVKVKFPQNFESLNLSELNPDVIGKPIYFTLKKCFELLMKKEGFSQAVIEDTLMTTWEKLNIGDWKSIDLNWRLCYSYASLIKVIYFVYFNVSESPMEMIEICDKGLMMGAPILDNILASLAQEFHLFVKEMPSDEVLIKEPTFNPKGLQNMYNPIPVMVAPSIITFMKIFKEKLPVVLTRCMTFWPALGQRKWNLKYLLKMAGCRIVPVELGSKYTDENWTQKLMKLKDFVDNYILKENDTKAYLAQYQLFEQIPILLEDIIVPDYCSLGDKEEDPDINVWFGPEGTVSPLHYDPRSNIFAQVFGYKYIRLYDAKFTPFLYPHEGMLLHNTSQVNVENPDLEMFPEFSKANYTECILGPGEMLLIPQGCWHYVKSLSTCFSISFWFS